MSTGGKKKNFLEDLQRVQADYENYVKRVEKEKEQVKLNAKYELLLKFINVKEELERAVKGIENEGLKMIQNNIIKMLEEENIKEIKAIGNKFDHNLHEAVKMEKGEENIVIEEIQKGYLWGDKVLRASKVIIGGKNEH